MTPNVTVKTILAPTPEVKATEPIKEAVKATEPIKEAKTAGSYDQHYADKATGEKEVKAEDPKTEPAAKTDEKKESGYGEGYADNKDDGDECECSFPCKYLEK